MSNLCKSCRKVKTLNPGIDPDSICVCYDTRPSKNRVLTDSNIDTLEGLLRAHGASKTVLRRVREYLEGL